MLSRSTSTGIAALAALALSACGPLTPAERAAEQGLRADNGLSPNGLSQNGLSQNGLSQNGLSQNGLSQNGLSTTAFSSWFDSNPDFGNAVMTYVVRCALPTGGVRTYTNKAGLTYTWYGLFDLAPVWASGKKTLPVIEQQKMTACLAAHVNKYGVHVPISVRGMAASSPIPVDATELADFSVREACFFGNLFANEGVYVGVDHTPWTFQYSSPRACAFDYRNTASTTDCAPIYQAGDCAALCTLDASGTFYTSCSYGGKTYAPITTRLRQDEVYRCGDGVCQFTESCGTGNSSFGSCNDCGLCP
jgi:hypothetical protein